MKPPIRKTISIIALCAVILSGCGSTSTSQETETVQEVIPVHVSETLAPAPTPIPTIRPFNHNDISMERVESSSLAKVGYDFDYSVLKVQFKDSGEYYIYYSVPYSTYTALLNADSIGSYFYYNVRTAFDYEKVS